MVSVIHMEFISCPEGSTNSSKSNWSFSCSWSSILARCGQAPTDLTFLWIRVQARFWLWGFQLKQQICFRATFINVVLCQGLLWNSQNFLILFFDFSLPFLIYLQLGLFILRLDILTLSFALWGRATFTMLLLWQICLPKLLVILLLQFRFWRHIDKWIPMRSALHLLVNRRSRLKGEEVSTKRRGNFQELHLCLDVHM